MATPQPSQPTFPPPSPSAVFTVVTTRHIRAPAKKVWDLLTDMATWPEWNAFVPSVEILERPSAAAGEQDGDAEAGSRPTEDGSGNGTGNDGKLELGMRLKFNVNMPLFFGRTASSASVEKVVLLETPSQHPAAPSSPAAASSSPPSSRGGTYRAHWAEDGTSDALLRALRVNDIEAVAGQDGAEECEYRTCEFFAGPVAWVIRMTVGGGVREGFELWADGLKRRAEGV